MRLEELLDGSPAGCVGVYDVVIDPRGMLWIRSGAEVVSGEPDQDHPYRIRRDPTVALDIRTGAIAPASLLEIPEEDIQRRPPRKGHRSDLLGWLPARLWRPWEQRRS